MYRLEARERLADAVRGVPDVDHGERVLLNYLQASGPARRAEARSDGGFDVGRGFSGPRPSQPEQEQGDRDGCIVDLERAQQARFEEAKLVVLEPQVEMLCGRRDGLVVDGDLVADKQGRNFAIAIIFEDVRPQAPAIFTVDDGASGCAGVALVGDDQFQRMAEQFDMLVIDRGHAGAERADQAYRVVTAADAGFEHREIATALLKIQASQREHRLKGSEFFVSPP